LIVNRKRLLLAFKRLHGALLASVRARSVAIVTLSLAVPALADEPPALAPGSRVARQGRSEGRESIRGTLASLDDERLTLADRTGGAARVIDRSRITRLELGARPASRGHGAASGPRSVSAPACMFTGVVAARECARGTAPRTAGLRRRSR
jgi:hypothetical protein